MKVMITEHRPPRLRGREKEVSAWIEEQLRELNPGLLLIMLEGNKNI